MRPFTPEAEDDAHHIRKHIAKNRTDDVDSDEDPDTATHDSTPQFMI